MQKIAILYDASQAVLSTFDLDEVLDRILAIARDYFRLQTGGILLLDKATQTLRVRSQFGHTPESEELRIPLGVGITGTAAKVKRPIYVPDVSKDPRYLRSIHETQSELAIPLMVRDEVVGVLDCQSSEINHFDPETMDLLTLFATQASIGLQNAQLYSLEQRRAAQLEAINAISKQTTAVLDLDELLKKVCSLLLQSFPLDHVAVFLRDDESNMVLRAHEGKLTPLIHEGDVLPEGSECLERAAETGKTALEQDVTTLSCGPQFEGTVSEIIMPLISFGETIGLLACYSSSRMAFLPNDVQALESVADIVSTAIQNARYVDRVRQLAYRDGLTGIFNRRFFDIRIEEEMERAARYSSALSVLMIDIDHFKQVNDDFGHLLGDEVLRQVASIFTLQLRKVDVICRYGGEEFAIVVPSTGGENALAVGEKLRKMVETFHFAGVPRPVTISIGVAEFPEHGTTRDSLVRAADAALYLAKQRGRNRVQSASMREFSKGS